MRAMSFILATLLVVGSAQAATLQGTARVVDGDTLVADGSPWQRGFSALFSHHAF